MREIIKPISGQSKRDDGNDILDSSLTSLNWLTELRCEIQNMPGYDNNDIGTSNKTKTNTKQKKVAMRAVTPSIKEDDDDMKSASSPFSCVPITSSSSSSSSSVSAKLAHKKHARRSTQAFVLVIKQALEHSSHTKVPLADIYTYIEHTYPVLLESSDSSWKNSVRYNLSQSKYFQRAKREAGDPGKGSLWTLGEKAHLIDSSAQVSTEDLLLVPKRNENKKSSMKKKTKATKLSKKPFAIKPEENDDEDDDEYDDDFDSKSSCSSSSLYSHSQYDAEELFPLGLSFDPCSPSSSSPLCNAPISCLNLSFSTNLDAMFTAAQSSSAPWVEIEEDAKNNHSDININNNSHSNSSQSDSNNNNNTDHDDNDSDASGLVPSLAPSGGLCDISLSSPWALLASPNKSELIIAADCRQGSASIKTEVDNLNLLKYETLQRMHNSQDDSVTMEVDDAMDVWPLDKDALLGPPPSSPHSSASSMTSDGSVSPFARTRSSSRRCMSVSQDSDDEELEKENGGFGNEHNIMREEDNEGCISDPELCVVGTALKNDSLFFADFPETLMTPLGNRLDLDCSASGLMSLNSSWPSGSLLMTSSGSDIFSSQHMDMNMNSGKNSLNSSGVMGQDWLMA